MKPRVALVLASLFALAAQAQTPETKTKDPAPSENPEEFSRVRGLFDVDLPKTLEQYHARIDVHPHFGDLIHRGYLRVPIALRVGLDNHTEVNAEVESYLTQGLKHPTAGYGFDMVRLGGKYQWQDWLKGVVDASSGLNVGIPVGRPPLDLTDGFYHVSPYVTFSKPWPGRPRLTPFVSFGVDLMKRSHVPGSFAKNEPRSDSMGTSVGFFYDADRFKYTLVCSEWTTALIGRGTKNFFSVDPSVLWELPPALKFHSRAQWIFGVGAKFNFGPDGTDIGTSAKLRGEFKFSRLWGK